MAESGGLENRCVREGTVGSNPTPSATSSALSSSQRSGSSGTNSCVRSLGHRMNVIQTLALSLSMIALDDLRLTVRRKRVA